MATALATDRLLALIDVLVESVELPARGAELARRAHFSRFHFDRLVAAALHETPAAFRRRLLLERAAYELRPPTPAFFDESPTIRSMLSRLVFTKEMWSAAIGGYAFVEDEDESIEGLRRRLAGSGCKFGRLVREIRERGDWDTVFVDTTCDPPHSFTYGGAVAHALTWNAQRRLILALVLEQRGVEVEGVDPLGWERRVA
ncbi:MAG TPA: hypothetical protein VGJ25_13900 [Gaiellaceae bacterium]